MIKVTLIYLLLSLNIPDVGTKFDVAMLPNLETCKHVLGIIEEDFKLQEEAEIDMEWWEKEARTTFNHGACMTVGLEVPQLKSAKRE